MGDDPMVSIPDSIENNPDAMNNIPLNAQAPQEILEEHIVPEVTPVVESQESSPKASLERIDKDIEKLRDGRELNQLTEGERALLAELMREKNILLDTQTEEVVPQNKPEQKEENDSNVKEKYEEAIKKIEEMRNKAEVERFVLIAAALGAAGFSLGAIIFPELRSSLISEGMNPNNVDLMLNKIPNLLLNIALPGVMFTAFSRQISELPQISEKAKTQWIKITKTFAYTSVALAGLAVGGMNTVSLIIDLIY